MPTKTTRKIVTLTQEELYAYLRDLGVADIPAHAEMLTSYNGKRLDISWTVQEEVNL